MAIRPPLLRLVPRNPGSSAPPASGVVATESREIPLEDLYRRFAPYVAAVATRILGRKSEVEDVVQDVFASAVRGLRRRDEVGQIKGWLAQVTVRSSLRQLRKRALWNLFDLAEPPNYERLVDPGSDPEEQRLVTEVYRALDRIPAKDRVAWILRYVEGESLESVAVLCGCSLATAKRRIVSAHQAVRRELGGRA